MAVYDVTVPFELLRFETLGSATTARLPESFELPGLEVTFDAEEEVYSARLQLSAPNITTAKRLAVEQVRDILKLAAAWGDAFRVRFGSGLVAEKLPEEMPPQPPPTPVPGEPGSVIAAVNMLTLDMAVLEAEGSVSMVKQRASVDFESRALSWREAWPGWLTTVLELNYLATISHDTETAFLVHYTTLEVLEEALVGKPVSIIRQELQDTKRGELLADIRQLLESYNLTDKYAKRLLERLRETQTESKVDRIARMLGGVGVAAQLEEVRQVIRQRGRVAHHGKSSEDEAVRLAATNARQWVLAALRTILEKRLLTLPNGQQQESQ